MSQQLIIETYRTNEDAFLLIMVKLLREQEPTKYLVYLIDPWKIGMRDFIEFTGSLMELKNEMGIPDIKFHKISKREAAEWLKRGYKIAKKLNLDIDPRGQKWLEKLGVPKIKLKGSLYKCFNCNEGDISNDDVEEILQIARDEIKKGIVGTEREEQYFYICKSCKQKMHKSHTK